MFAQKVPVHFLHLLVGVEVYAVDPWLSCQRFTVLI